jgi:hypothetical protein
MKIRIAQTHYFNHRGERCTMYVQQTKAGYYAVRWHKLPFFNRREFVYVDPSTGHIVRDTAQWYSRIQLVGKYDSLTDAVQAVTDRFIRMEKYYNNHTEQIKVSRIYRRMNIAVDYLRAAYDAIYDSRLIRYCYRKGMDIYEECARVKDGHFITAAYINEHDLGNLFNWAMETRIRR